MGTTIATASAGRISRRAHALRSSEIRDLLHLTRRPDVISLAGGLPDPSCFPTDELAEAAHRAITDRSVLALQYGPTEGDPALRERIADRHQHATGRPTHPDQVLVTTGSQQGLDLLARVLGDPGDTVAVEDPGYLGALQAFKAAGLRLLPIHLDDGGLRVDALAALLTGPTPDRPAFVYTVPTFQNPTGVTLAPDRRTELAALADEHDLLVVEDTPYADLRFSGPALLPVASATDRVITLGTTSKTLAPGLRVGWMIGPRWLIAATTRAKQAVDLHTSSLSQAVVADLLADPAWFDRQVATVAERYGQRAATLEAALADRLGHRIALTRPSGGMFCWARIPGLDARSLLPAAVDEGTAFVPGDAFAVEADLRDRLRLSFAAADEARLVEAVARLTRALDRTHPA
jgi:2-aminoadipate transaminase